MNEASSPRARQAVPTALQAAGTALTAVVALTASAALAWSLRSWREGPKPPSRGATALPASGGAGDRQAVVLGAGRLAYHVHCARCHGAGGHGDGSDAERLAPPPRDFASHRWRLAPTAESIRQAIVTGIPGTAMPGWGTSLSPRELDGLVAYVLAFAPTNQAGRKESTAELLPSTLVALLERAGFSAEATPRPAPTLALRDLDGKATSLADHRDQPVLVMFWGTTCSHCLAELPAAVRFCEQLRDQGYGFDVLPVCVDETEPAVVRAVAGSTATRQPLYLDPSATARLYYDVQALPGFVLIDRSGRVIGRSSGTRDWSDPALDELIHECLALSAAADRTRPTTGREDGNATRPDHRPG
jgi:mono/diheme cytochrome c family protein/peroxiredoxin